MTTLLLILTISLSVGRNVLSKNTARVPFLTRSFFLMQAALFGVGTLILSAFGAKGLFSISTTTLVYAIIYGIILIMAQWSYTAALERGAVSVCSTVYSLGFIIPTVFGMAYFGDTVTVLKVTGLILATASVLLAGRGKGGNKNGKAPNAATYAFLALAMLCSGALGVLQKLHQSTEYATERTSMILIAFTVAATASLIAAIPKGRAHNADTHRVFIFAPFVGVCFAICNILNTYLSGKLPSYIFFPVLNISIIAITATIGILFFKERLTKSKVIMIALAAVSIIMLGVA